MGGINCRHLRKRAKRYRVQQPDTAVGREPQADRVGQKPQADKTPQHGGTAFSEQYHGTILQPLVRRLVQRLDMPQIPEASFEEYEITGFLGEGAHSSVLQVTHRTTHASFAAKRMKKGRVVGKPLPDELQNELNILAALNFQFTVKLHACAVDNQCVYLITDLVPCGDFGRFLAAKELKEVQARFYIAQLVLAVEYLHGANVIHRDIKAANLLLDADGYAKLADFGLARRLDRTRQTYGRCGTELYMAPEIKASKGYGLGADWWAVGTFSYRAVFHHDTYSTQAKNKLYRPTHPIVLPETASNDAQSFIGSLLELNPQARLGVAGKGAEEVRNHAFFSQLNWVALYEKKYPAPYCNQPAYVKSLV